MDNAFGSIFRRRQLQRLGHNSSNLENSFKGQPMLVFLSVDGENASEIVANFGEHDQTKYSLRVDQLAQVQQEFVNFPDRGFDSQYGIDCFEIIRAVRAVRESQEFFGVPKKERIQLLVKNPRHGSDTIHPVPTH